MERTAARGAPTYPRERWFSSVKKRFRSLLLALAVAASLAATASAAGGPTVAGPDDIVILYTNDVHTYIDRGQEEGGQGALTYSKVAGYKSTLDNVLLVDAGDAIQGTAYGSMDNGATIIELMNAAGYDVATLGNHEFDFGMERILQIMQREADFPYVSCNLYHLDSGTPGANVLDSYQVLEVNGVRVALLGITTPESITKSTPAYFQDENGNYIYGIAGGEDGTELYQAVQQAIDQAAQEADYVIALGHLGVDPSSSPWTSEELIANTTGLDAFIDGHSHTSVEMELVEDQEGNPVVLTQTGSYLDALGQMTISADGTITTQLLTGQDLADVTPDAGVLAIEQGWIDSVNDELGQVIGYTDDVLDNYDDQGNRLVRRQETNTGDFAADALYYLFDNMGLDVDVAVMNGGGIRNEAVTGELSYLTCRQIHTFGNVACLQTVTGQQILDALEWGAKDVSDELPVENGGFLQVSGLRYTINTAIPSTVQQDDHGVWTGGPTGAYRVSDVQVLNNETGAYEPLDLTASYNLAGYNYTLRNLGDGFAMFDGAVNVLDYVMEDYMVLANYIQSFPANADGLHEVTGYGQVDNRITIVHQAPSTLYDDVASTDWYFPAVEYVTQQGYMVGIGENLFDPSGTTTRGALMTMLARFDGNQLEATDPWYQAGMEWAVAEGVSDGTMPTETVTRVQAVTMMWRLAGRPEAQADLSAYIDRDQVPSWGLEAIEWAVSNGIMQGSDSQLNPNGTSTRAQIAQLMMQFSKTVTG